MSLTFALQALLIRHETYVAEAEEERRQMAASMDKLEKDKKELEIANATTIEENRDLLDQLEDLNTTVSKSDAYIHSLATTLKSTRREIERLTTLAARSTDLEAQLLAMETEQTDLQDELASTMVDQRSAVHRWKNAERTISGLQEQVDRMEQEANEERERHEQVVARFERRKAVEHELESAAGRLNGAAATKTSSEKGKSSNVVSHFVKDILQDNANLQMGIVELREMLMGSNDEIENLREQMLLHQPTLSFHDDGAPKTILQSELARSAAAEAVPELHVHHHYHPAGKAKPTMREKPPMIRRPRNRRSVAPARPSTQPSSLHTRTSSTNSMKTTSRSSAAAILSQTSVTIPPYQSLRPPRWSLQSSQNSSSIAPSSVPSSPQSAFRNLSMFDRIDAMDSSRPTSPDSTDIGSPIFLSRQKRRSSNVSLASLSVPIAPQVKSTAIPTDVLQVADGEFFDSRMEKGPRSDSPNLDHSAILEEPEEDLLPEKLTLVPNPRTSVAEVFSSPLHIHPRLHRSASHESMLSVRHPSNTIPLRHKPSQLLANGTLSSRTPLSISTPSVDPTAATAQPTYSHSLRLTSSKYNRSLLSARIPSSTNNSSHRVYNNDHPAAAAAAAATSPSPVPASAADKFPTFSKRMGGWMTGKWGIAPMASTGDLRAKATARSTRATGVNQNGSIRGLVGAKSYMVEARHVDENALRESLGEG